MRQPLTLLRLVEHRVGRDVDPPVEDPVLDPHRGREREQARGIGPDRGVRDFRRDRVERRHRLGEVHGVVEPEPLVVLRLEPREVGIHRLPPLRAQNVGDLGRQRERPLTRCLGHHCSSAPSRAPAPAGRPRRPGSGNGGYGWVRRARRAQTLRPPPMCPKVIEQRDRPACHVRVYSMRPSRRTPALRRVRGGVADQRRATSRRDQAGAWAARRCPDRRARWSDRISPAPPARHRSRRCPPGPTRSCPRSLPTPSMPEGCERPRPIASATSPVPVGDAEVGQPGRAAP